jgi:hydrogenase maturation protein HypF
MPIALPLLRDGQGIWRTDWTPLLPLMLDKARSQRNRAMQFHSSLAHALLAQALVVREETASQFRGTGGGRVPESGSDRAGYEFAGSGGF